MKKIICCIAVSILFAILTACALADGTLTLPSTLTTVEEEAFFGDTTISTVIGQEGLTTIGARAFANSGLYRIHLPESIASIAADAFDGCPDMKAVVAPGGKAEALCIAQQIPFLSETPVSDFYYEENADGTILIGYYFGTDAHVVVPETIDGKTVTVIDSYAFADADTLVSVTLPNNLHTIRDYAFDDSPNLASVTFGSGLTTIGYAAFSNCPKLTSVALPDSVTFIDGFAFSDCTSLTSFSLGKKTADVGNYILSGCSQLTALDLGESLTSIPEYAFRDCTSLTSITMPDSVHTIEQSAFRDCTSLAQVVFSSGLKTIESYAFYNCTALQTYCLPDNITSFSSRSFYNSNINLMRIRAGTVTATTWGQDFISPSAPDFKLSQSLDEDGKPVVSIAACLGSTARLVIPGTVDGQPIHIPERLFYDDESITSVVLSEGVVSVGEYAFYSCSGMTELSLPESLRTIGSNAFCICTGLTEVTLPRGIQSIGSNAFSYCTNLMLTVYSGSEGEYRSLYHNWPYLLADAANAGEYNGFTYVLRSDNTISITGYTGADASVTVPADIQGRAVTSIGHQCFKDQTAITSITLPDSITSLGSSAFYGCTSLVSVNLPKGITAIGEETFRGCEGLTAIVIPDGAVSIGKQAFYGCSALASITMPDSVLTIGENVFQSCYVLDNVVLPKKLKRIEPDTFNHCQGMTSIILPEGLTFIGESAFSSCDSLSSIDLPSSVKSIGTYAFNFCGSLPSVVIPQGVTAIPQGVFYQCTSLRSVGIPDSVKSIGQAAFSGCSSLASIDLPDGLTSLGDSAFSSCTALTYIDLPDGITSIGGHTFRGCTKLADISLPLGLKKIGDYAFSECRGLVVLELPSETQSIGAGAFYRCSSMDSLFIPEAAMDIDYTACKECDPDLLICGVAGSEAEFFADACGFTFSASAYPEWLGRVLPEEYFRVYRTFRVGDRTYYEIDLIKACNGVQPQTGYLYLDHRYRVVRNPFTLAKLYTMSLYFDRPVTDYLNNYDPDGMAWYTVAIDFINDEQMMKTLGSSGAIIVKLAMGDVSAVVDYIGLVDNNQITSAALVANINMIVDHLNKALAQARSFAEDVADKPAYDDVVLSLEHLRYCAVFYNAALGMCEPIIDDILSKYTADWQLGLSRLVDGLASFAGGMNPYVKALITGVTELASGDPDAVSILTSLMEYLGGGIQLAGMTINAQSGAFNALSSWTSVDPAGMDHLIEPYFLTVEEIRSGGIYSNQQKLGQ